MSIFIFECPTIFKQSSEVVCFLKEGEAVLASTSVPCSILKDLGVKDILI